MGAVSTDDAFFTVANRFAVIFLFVDDVYRSSITPLWSCRVTNQ